MYHHARYIFEKMPFLSRTMKNTVIVTKYLNQLTRSFLLNPKYNDTAPLCLKIREAKDGNGAGDIWGTTVRNWLNSGA